MKNGIIFAESSKTKKAYWPHLWPQNECLHYMSDGDIIPIGFCSKRKGNRWMKVHHNGLFRLKRISVEDAFELWNPYLMIIKDIDMEWDLRRIQKHSHDEYKAAGLYVPHITS